MHSLRRHYCDHSCCSVTPVPCVPGRPFERVGPLWRPTSSAGSRQRLANDCPALMPSSIPVVIWWLLLHQMDLLIVCEVPFRPDIPTVLAGHLTCVMLLLREGADIEQRNVVCLSVWLENQENLLCGPSCTCPACT